MSQTIEEIYEFLLRPDIINKYGVGEKPNMVKGSAFFAYTEKESDDD